MFLLFLFSISPVVSKEMQKIFYSRFCPLRFFFREAGGGEKV